jgi:hypothetical protein
VTVDDVIARMVALLDPLEADGDPGRYFLGTYLRITRAVRAALADGTFEDAAWVERWDVDFAGLYLDALEAHRRDPATAPAPWRRAFSASPTLRPEGHVLLGVNAHINFDLPQSLVRVIPAAEFGDPHTLARRRRDHERIDGVLASRVATEDVELQRAGDPRTWLDRLLTPVNHLAAAGRARGAQRRPGRRPAAARSGAAPARGARLRRQSPDRLTRPAGCAQRAVRLLATSVESSDDHADGPAPRFVEEAT